MNLPIRCFVALLLTLFLPVRSLAFLGITEQPASLELQSGLSAALSVTATDSEAAPLNYQWFRGFSGDTTVPISGANSPVLITPALTSPSLFWVRVSTASATLNSRTATVSLPVTAPLALLAYGVNTLGQLGDGTSLGRTTPMRITTGVTAVSSGGNHSLYIDASSSLWAMGYNQFGQLGDGTTANRLSPVPITSNVIAVSAGAYHTLFIKSDSSLWAMGYNFFGQLGDGTSTDRATPVQITTGVVAVSAGDSHPAFLKHDGTLWAMGEYNRLPGRSTVPDPTHFSPTQIASGVKSLSAGDYHTLFIKTDDSLWGMGYNAYGQLGDGTATFRLVPVPIASGVSTVAGGYGHTLFVKKDHSLWAMGTNSSGQLGDGTTTNRLSPVLITSDVSSVSAGFAHSVFIKTDRSVWAMGANSRGELGNGGTVNQLTPVPITTRAITVETGYHHSLLLVSTHTVSFLPGAYGTRSGGGALTQAIAHNTAALAPTISPVAGWAFSGWDTTFSAVTSDLTVTAQYIAPTAPVISAQPTPMTIEAGNSAILSVTASANAAVTYQWYQGSSLDVSVPVIGATGPQLATPPLNVSSTFWVKVTNAGQSTYSSFAAVTVIPPPYTLTLFTCGDNFYGQLGVATPTTLVTPAPLLLGFTSLQRSVASASAGASRSLFIKTDASLWAMGNNKNGELGDGTNTNRFAPTHIHADVASVSTKSTHTLFVTEDTSLWAMGSNISGQLGDGSTTSRNAPLLVTSGVSSAIAGNEFSLFIKTDASLWGMGRNKYNQLGGGNPVPTLPIFIESSVSAAAAGIDYILFIKTDASLWGVGANSNGQLGDGSNIDRSAPVLIANNVRSVSAGDTHSLFIKTDGTLWAMGSNSFGQLGNGSNTPRNTPVKIATDVRSVSAGTSHSLFIKTDGTLWSMGRNASGQLGDGTTLDRTIPQQIASRVASAAAGGAHSLFYRAVPPIVPLPTGGGTVAYGDRPIVRVAATGSGTLSYQWYQGISGDTSTPLIGAIYDKNQLAPLTVSSSFWVRVTDGGGSTDSPTLDITVTAPTPFQAWATTSGLAINTLTPTADPDADGVPNLLEYAFGTRPGVANSRTDDKPRLTATDVDGETWLVLTHRRAKAAKVTTIYQQSTDLITWQTIEATPVVINSDADGDGLVEFVLIARRLSTAPGLFLRLTVAQ